MSDAMPWRENDAPLPRFCTVSVIHSSRNPHPSSFLLGEEISVADLFAACEIMQPWSAGFDVCATRPRVAEWMKDVISATQPHFDQAHIYNQQIKDTTGVAIQEAYQAYLEGLKQTQAAGGQ